jgi:hypothetical protein
LGIGFEKSRQIVYQLTFLSQVSKLVSLSCDYFTLASPLSSQQKQKLVWVYNFKISGKAAEMADA